MVKAVYDELKKDKPKPQFTPPVHSAPCAFGA